MIALAISVVALLVGLCSLLVTAASYGGIVVRRHEPVSGVMDRFAVWVWRRRPKRWLP
jgi:hypothetical protein